jgi:hypothetical protein
MPQWVVAQQVADRHGQRVWLLTGRAAGTPDTQPMRGCTPLQDVGDDLLPQRIELWAIAEKVRLADRQMYQNQIPGALVGHDILVQCFEARVAPRMHRQAKSIHQIGTLVFRVIESCVRQQEITKT